MHYIHCDTLHYITTHCSECIEEGGGGWHRLWISYNALHYMNTLHALQCITYIAMHYIHCNTLHYNTTHCIECREEGGRRLTETLIDDLPAAPPAGEIPSTTVYCQLRRFNVKSQIQNVWLFNSNISCTICLAVLNVESYLSPLLVSETAMN